MRIRARNAAREYEITLEQYSEMVEQQAGRCAVCSRKRKLAVDHCHKTGKVRALLCYPCNIALGQVNDNVKLLMDLAGYVSRHAENEPQPSSLPNAPQQRTPLHATPH